MTCESSCELARKLEQMCEAQTVVCFQLLYASTLKQKQCFPGSQYSNILLKKIRSVNVTDRSDARCQMQRWKLLK